MGYKRIEFKYLTENYEFDVLLGLVLEKLIKKEEIMSKSFDEGMFLNISAINENESNFFIYINLVLKK